MLMLPPSPSLPLSNHSTPLSSSPRPLHNRLVVVTASTDGIGLAIAQRLLEDGAHVLISSRRATNVKKALAHLAPHAVSGSLALRGIVCHVSKEEDQRKLKEAAVEMLGASQPNERAPKLHALVLNAATNPTYSEMFEEDHQKAWDVIMKTNVTSNYRLMALFKDILHPTQGNVVLISSILGYAPNSNLGAYSVSKTAMLGLIKAAARSLAPIRVNGVAPGIIKTRFSRALWEEDSISKDNNGNDPEVDGMGKIPLGRFGHPEDISGVVAFLVGDDARYITSETIVAAGGLHSRL